MSSPTVKIGCEAYITRDNKLLLGKRGQKIFGAGTWALPGGHLEFLERADECIIRELEEELGCTVGVEDLKLLSLVDDLRHSQSSHYVHITFAVDISLQEPSLMEPEACEEWRWFPLDELPKNIFPPHQKIFDKIKTKQTY